jgi:hypothetical protein
MVIILLLLCLLFPIAAQATVLGDAAAKLSPGQWAIVPMQNVAITGSTLAWDNVGGTSGPGYDGPQAGWDSHTRKLYIQTVEHGAGGSCPGPNTYPTLPHVCWKPTWTYDTDTDTWSTGTSYAGGTTGDGRPNLTLTGVYPNSGGTPVNHFHVWNDVAWDDVNEVLYTRDYATFPPHFYRYCVNNTPSWCTGKQGVWSALPAGPTQRNGNYHNAMMFHEALNSSTGGTLLAYDGSGYASGCGGLYGFRENLGTWSVISESNCALPTGSDQVLAAYSHTKQLGIFGAGSGGGTNGPRHFFKITSAGAGSITQLDDAPCDMSTTNGGFAMQTEDPVSGDFYFVACDKQFWKLNATASTGSQWTLIDSSLAGTGEICNVLRNTSEFCAVDIYAIPISTYGVIGYWKFKSGMSAEFWIYKASPGGGGGGSDFATRCIGALFCNGFDSVGDLGGDGWGNARGRGPSDGTVNCGANNCPTIDTTTKVSGTGALKFVIPPGASGAAAGSYWANPSTDFSIRFGANQTYYVQFRQRVTASYFPSILVDNGKIHWVSTTPDLPGCTPSTTAATPRVCFASCTENEFVNQNNYGVASDSLPRWYNGCPGANTFEFIEPVTPGQYKLQNARTGLGCTYDNVNAGNRFPPKGNCFPYYPDQWVTYSYKISLGSLGTGGVGGRCYDAGSPGSITPNLQNCYYGSQIQARMGLDGQPLEEVLNWTGPVVAKDQTNPTELKYGKVWFSPYTGSATIASGAAMWFDELIISTAPIADPGSGGTITPPANVTLTRRRIQ